jgi:MFS family permease
LPFRSEGNGFGAAGALWLLFPSRVIDGITGGNISIAQAFIADVTPSEDRSKAFGLIGAAFGLGFIIGPALGGLLSNLSLSAPAYFAGGLALANVALGYFILPESLPAERRTREPLTFAKANPVGDAPKDLQASGRRWARCPSGCP